jgi:pimeloyl-ACP methyl ester carboxylesterase
MPIFRNSQNLDDLVGGVEGYEEQYIRMSDGAYLRILSHQPENPKGTLYFVPGWLTLPRSWDNVLKMLAEDDYHVEYLESREKRTAKLPKDSKITKERMIQDVVEVPEKLGLDRYIAVASSLGSNMLIHTMAQEGLEPEHAIIIGVWDYEAPSFLLPLVNGLTYPPIKKFLLKPALSRKYSNSSDTEQEEKYRQGLDLAVPSRFRSSTRAWNGDTVWDDLPRIGTHCIVIGANKDILHSIETTHKIADGLPNSTYHDLETNKAAHGKPLVELITNQPNS